MNNYRATKVLQQIQMYETERKTVETEVASGSLGVAEKGTKHLMIGEIELYTNEYISNNKKV